ncbi:protein S100-P-like [Cynoglossus semilaevis]|uniref:S100 calcium binding protein P n=1 Tax=Cynoglossus semilaevis TaxID=244447 RepID=A0A3P8WTJ2_CYNSE|nr:protein S100-P-like [Cynoglossus semilaevis]
MTQLESAMGLLMKVFDTYASGEGKRDTLTRSETKALLQKELPTLMKAAKNPEELEKLLNGLDFNGDSEVDFSEFVTMISVLTSVLYGGTPKK